MIVKELTVHPLVSAFLCSVCYVLTLIYLIFIVFREILNYIVYIEPRSFVKFLLL